MWRRGAGVGGGTGEAWGLRSSGCTVDLRPSAATGAGVARFRSPGVRTLLAAQGRAAVAGSEWRYSGGSLDWRMVVSVQQVPSGPSSRLPGLGCVLGCGGWPHMGCGGNNEMDERTVSCGGGLQGVIQVLHGPREAGRMNSRRSRAW